MSYTTEPMPTAHVRRIVALSAAGQTAAQIAKTLIDEGVPVPRAGGHPSNWPEHGVVSTPVAAGVEPTGEGDCATIYVVDQAFPEARNGHCLATEPGNPSRWTAAAVAQVLAAPEASPTNNYAAARAKLGSDSSTTLSVD